MNKPERIDAGASTEETMLALGRRARAAAHALGAGDTRGKDKGAARGGQGVA